MNSPEKAEQVVRDGEGRWGIGELAIMQTNGHAAPDESGREDRSVGIVQTPAVARRSR
jgi:hypothetical protein